MTKDELDDLNCLYRAMDHLNVLADAISDDIPIIIYSGKVTVELPYFLNSELKKWVSGKAAIAKDTFDEVKIK